MSITSGFYNSLNGDRRYDAEQLSAIFNGIINDGVFASVGTTFAVIADGKNTVTVGVGRAWFNSTWIYNDAVMTLATEESDTLFNRYDAVVIEVNRNAAVRAATIKIVQGTPASTPTVPTMIHTSEVNQYPLAYIYRAAASEAIMQIDITNAVGTSSCPFVTGILQVVNIDNMVAQWMAEWEQLTAAKDAEFSAFITTWNNRLTELSNGKTSELNAAKAEWEQMLQTNDAAFDQWFNNIKESLGETPVTDLLNRILALENGTTAAGKAIKDGDGNVIKDTYSKTSHTHTQYAGTSHNQAASTITAGTLAGKVLANATSVATVGDKQVRNIYAGTTDMVAGTTSLATGDIYIMYE